MAKILDGRAVAAEIRSEVAEEVSRLKEQGISPRLDVVLVGEDPASVTYVNMKQRDCAEVGIESRAHRFPADVSQKELAVLVDRLNEDDARIRQNLGVLRADAAELELRRKYLARLQEADTRQEQIKTRLKDAAKERAALERHRGRRAS